MRFTSIAVVLNREMSSCLSALDPVAKTRYFSKIQLVGLTASEDPYEMWKEGKFEEDMTLWPPVEYGHIFCYFVERPGTFTKKQLLQWKSIEAYNYFQSGHVRDVKVYTVLATCSRVLMAYVNPSQSSPENAHLSWIAVKFDGAVITAHCTCKAG